jgi:hypothetical protein
MRARVSLRLLLSASAQKHYTQRAQSTYTLIVPLSSLVVLEQEHHNPPHFSPSRLNQSTTRSSSSAHSRHHDLQRLPPHLPHIRHRLSLQHHGARGPPSRRSLQHVMRQMHQLQGQHRVPLGQRQVQHFAGWAEVLCMWQAIPLRHLHIVQGRAV